MTSFQLVGINDHEDSCSLCGKTGLKRVAWLVTLDADGNREGDAEHYGTDCAGKLLHGSKCKKNTDLVLGLGERIEKMRRWIQAGHDLEKCVKAWRNSTCNGAEVVGNGVLVYWGKEKILVTP